MMLGWVRFVRMSGMFRCFVPQYFRFDNQNQIFLFFSKIPAIYPRNLSCPCFHD